jgi:RHH-type rel operon transcriptional repressor/antitoxin RelB
MADYIAYWVKALKNATGLQRSGKVQTQYYPGRASMLRIRLPPEIETRLEKLAVATGRTKAFYAQQAISEYLGDLEDTYLAEQRAADIRAGRTQTIPLENVMKHIRR